MSIAEKLTQIAENERRAGQILTECNAHLIHAAPNMTELPMLIEVSIGTAAQEAEQSGYNIGYDVGYGNGKQAEYDAFWDTYQENGNRVQYIYAFSGRGWTNENFKPKYAMHCGTGAYMFSGTGVTHLDTDKLDMSAAGDFAFMFYGSMSTNYLQYIGALNMSSATRTTNMFHSCGMLKEIELLTLPNDPTKLTNVQNMFNGCNNLQEVRFAGMIPLSISFQWSPKLSHDSLMSIIDALRDLTGTGTTCTLTIGATNYAKLTQEEIEVAQNKGWTVN